MENKILIHADINLNVVDGATIWWSNTINVFIQGGIDIIYISNYKITNDTNLRNIENKTKLTLINPDKNLNPTETLKKIEEYGNQVKSILLRSNLILEIINENWNLLSKTIIYGLDIHLNNIKKLNNKFKKVWTQSEKLKKLFETNGINNLKIVPVVAYKYNFNLPERKDNEIRLIYTGTLRDEENIIEIIEEFQNIHKERPEVILQIVYGKIHGDYNFVNKVNTYIKTGVKGITFKYNLSHKDTCYEIATSDIGICWRKNKWGDNYNISTKVKEYQLYGLDIYYTMKKQINVLGIFGNIDTSNASSILLMSLLKKLPKTINIFYYKLPIIGCNDIKEFDLFTKKLIEPDKNKIINNINEIKTMEEVQGKLNNNFFNVILSWSNPYDTSTIGVYLSKKYNIPIVSRFGDFYINPKSNSNYLKLIDYKMINSINVPNEKLKTKIIEYYGKENCPEINIISQSFEPYNSKIIKKNEYIAILHTGNMYQKRKIDPFINVLKNININILKKIKLIFIGCHDKLDNDIELCKKANINADFSKCYQFENWLFEKSIPYEKIRDDLSNADILIHIEYVEDNNHFLSFKLIDYLSYNKPIITITQKNSPNYNLALECGFAFGNIENETELLNSLNKIISNPNEFIPNNNKNIYHINNISKKWEYQLFKHSNKQNYEWVNILEKDIDNNKLKIWIKELNNNSFYDNRFNNIKKYENLYTIWVLTIPFSKSLIYTMNNLNYLGYKYKIILNDNECKALNYAKNNTYTKFWFRYDDDMLMLKNSIEYMVQIKKKIKEDVCIFRLYDLNYGYKLHNKIDCFARYGIKIHNTINCKKYDYFNNNNTDLFYKNIKYLNYEDWKNNGIIVGYHALFNSDYDVFLLFLKMAYKYKLYGQDIEIMWNYFINIINNRELLILFLINLNKKYNLKVENIEIENIFEYNKIESIIKKYTYLKNNDIFMLKYNKSQLDKDIKDIYNKLNNLDIIKICGFISGLQYIYDYTYESNNLIKELYNNIEKNIKKDEYEIIVCNDINNIDKDTIEKYNLYKKENKKVKIHSLTPLISLCNKISIYDII
jgi:hypothetical protein